MIVDFHRHLWSVLERYPRVRELAARSPATPFDVDKSNVMLELSMWQWNYQLDPVAFVGALSLMKRRIGTERILFASDYPGLSQAMGLREWVEVFHGLPQLAEQHGYEFDEADVAAILGGNAMRILARQ